MLTLAGVLGFPVAHSRSPAMHNAALRALGVDWRYLKLPVPPELFVETVRALPGSGYRGANVTIPHKMAALAVADRATSAARAIGAANTLTFSSAGIEADNTDAAGLLDALEPALEHPARGVRALVLGAGGAARAAVWALGQAGAAEVVVWNRTYSRAEALARELDAVAIREVSGDPETFDLLVNATSVGLAEGVGEEEALEALGLLGRNPPPTVVDLVYGERPTPVFAWAERGRVRTVDGLEVLARQGARSLERWTGRRAPVEVMRKAARTRSGAEAGEPSSS